VAYFTSRIAAIPTQGEFSLLQVMHTQVEKSNVLEPSIRETNCGVDSKVHVAIIRCIIVLDGQLSGRREEFCKV